MYPFSCWLAEDLKALFPGPHRCFYEYPPGAAEVRNGHEFVYRIMEEEGPFDGILGLSHGAELAASVLIEHAKRHPARPPSDLFKCAIFIGGVHPYEVYTPDVTLSRQELSASGDSNQHIDSTGVKQDGDQIIGERIRQVHPDTHSVRIDIPTAHIMGRRDEIFRQCAKLLLRLCNERKAKVYEHKGGHLIPRGQSAMDEMTAAVGWVIDRVIFER